MKKRIIKNAAALLTLLLPLYLTAYTSAQDQKGSNDHPLLTRMPGFYIDSYEVDDFGKYEFAVESGAVSVEGRYYEINYILNDGERNPSELQIVKNHTAAIKKIGGQVLYEDEDQATLKVAKEGMEIWVLVAPHSGGEGYRLHIVEKGEMAQEVTASAEALSKDILTTGHAAIYGIYFDFNKADLKPESGPTLQEIARLMEKNPSLTLYVVGHTDNVGDLDHNLKLSRSRAEAVVNELVTAHNSDPARLKAGGVGPFSPLMSNRTEAGRAKNRRVELVEQ